MYLDALKWRREHQPWAMQGKQDKQASDARVVGFDRVGRWASGVTVPWQGALHQQHHGVHLYLCPARLRVRLSAAWQLPVPCRC